MKMTKILHVDEEDLREFILCAMRRNSEYAQTGDVLVVRDITFDPKKSRYSVSVYRLEKQLDLNEDDVKDIIQKEQEKSRNLRKTYGDDVIVKKCGCVCLRFRPRGDVLMAQCWSHFKRELAR